MKVGVYQTDPVLLDVKTNLEATIQNIEAAKAEGVDLMVFPELSLTGYFVRERYHEAALRIDSPEIKQLAEATKGTAAVVGFIEESEAMNFYNSALVAVDGEIVFAYRKLNLPNYGVFEERKIFSGGKHVRVFRLKGLTIAPFICNDLWHPSLPYLGITQQADIFITMFNSSRGSMGNEFSNIESWSIINRFYSRVFGVYNICANRVGCEVFENLRSQDEASDSTPAATVDDNPFRFWGGQRDHQPLRPCHHLGGPVRTRYHFRGYLTGPGAQKAYPVALPAQRRPLFYPPGTGKDSLRQKHTGVTIRRKPPG